jgi:hypothetical protein
MTSSFPESCRDDYDLDNLCFFSPCFIILVKYHPCSSCRFFPAHNALLELDTLLVQSVNVLIIFPLVLSPEPLVSLEPSLDG